MVNFLYILTGIGAILVLISCILVIIDLRKKNFANDYNVVITGADNSFVPYKGEYKFNKNDAVKEVSLDNLPEGKVLYPPAEISRIENDVV